MSALFNDVRDYHVSYCAVIDSELDYIQPQKITLLQLNFTKI